MTLFGADDLGMAGLAQRRRVLLTVGTALCVLFALLVGIQPGSTAARDAAEIGLAAVAIGAGLVAAQRAWFSPRRTRSVWILFSLGALTSGAGSATTAAYGVGLKQPQPQDVVSTLALIGVTLIALALLRLPPLATGAARRIRTVVDCGLVVLSAIQVGWVLMLRDLIQTGRGGNVAIAYAVADTLCVALAGFAIVQGRRLAPTPLFSAGLLGLATVTAGAADVAADGRLLDAGHAYGHPVDIWMFASWVLLALGAAFGSPPKKLRSPFPESDSAPRAWEKDVKTPLLNRPRPAQVVSEPAPVADLEATGSALVLPYLLLALPLGLAAGWLLTGQSLSLFPGSCLIGIVVLVVARQLLVLLENTTLTRHLEDRVRARTEEVSSSDRRFRSLVAHSSDVTLVVDSDHIVTWASDSVATVFGHDPERLIGTPLPSLLRLVESPSVLAELEAAAKAAYSSRRLSFALLAGTGRWHETETVVTSLLDDPDVGGMVLNSRDVTERAELEEQLTHQAFHDALTRLANRALFRDRLGHALSAAPRHGRPLAVLLLDLDGFKAVNDSLGHDTGDDLLVAVANRLIQTVADGDTVARLGGDEFAVLVEDLADDRAAESIAARIVAVLDRPVHLKGRELPVRCSVGIAWVDPADGEVPTTEDLLRNADLAMYRAKAAGGGWQRFEPAMHTALVARVQEEADLRGALERGELFLEYQPTVELTSGRIVGVEALVRWLHPTRGLVSPGEFITVAEDTGLIVAIGQWVLRVACHQALEWTDAGLTVAVNVSGRQLQRSDFATTVSDVLAETGLAAGRLVLELTESVLLDSPEVTVAQLTSIRARGTKVAVDDFGTGYSSLSYLARFPVDILKVDRSFVDRLGNQAGLKGGATEAALARTIVQLGHSLDLITVAEGIEHADQLQALRAMGCEHGQGFYFAQPVAGHKIRALLDAERAAAATSVKSAAG